MLFSENKYQIIANILAITFQNEKILMHCSTSDNLPNIFLCYFIKSDVYNKELISILFYSPNVSNLFTRNVTTHK